MHVMLYSYDGPCLEYLVLPRKIGCACACDSLAPVLLASIANLTGHAQPKMWKWERTERSHPAWSTIRVLKCSADTSYRGTWANVHTRARGVSQTACYFCHISAFLLIFFIVYLLAHKRLLLFNLSIPGRPLGAACSLPLQLATVNSWCS